MAEMAAKMVSQFFEAQGFPIEQIDDCHLKITTGLKSGNRIDVLLSFSKDDNRVSLEGYNFLIVAEEKFDSMYKVINDCNEWYNQVKFVLDKEHKQICARDDDIIQLDSCGQECLELVIGMLYIVSDAYPKFMKAMWGGAE